MGMGISGGEEGVRNDSALMPGGPQEGFDRIEPIIKAVAAQTLAQPISVLMGQETMSKWFTMVSNMGICI